jgi:ABC-2 type transport system ATP-binding protein
MEILKVENLMKNYPTFKLDDVSFSLEKGKIMGFIGRNGAGKSTTLKAIMGLVHLESGTVSAFGEAFDEKELANRTRISFSLGGVNFFPFKTVDKLTKVTARFYPKWSFKKFYHYLELFGINRNKKIKDLSEGMKVKYSLAVALSHDAELFILDEPTSGLDPVSRDEVLYVFKQLVKNGDRSILFSTHITSDLEKCADTITYIRNGKLVTSNMSKEEFINSYKLVSVPKKDFNDEIKSSLISFRDEGENINGLIESNKVNLLPNFVSISVPDLESIMVYLEWENNDEKFAI